MKNSLSKQVLFGAAITTLGISAFADTIAYNNSNPDSYLGSVVTFTNNQYVGNQIILDSANLYLTGFSLSYYSSGAVSASAQMDVQFYLNDGATFNGYPTPGTLIYDSGSFGVTNWGNVTLNFDSDSLYGPGAHPLVGALPSSNFTFVVSFSGLDPEDQVGVLLFNPPTVGENYADYWYNDGGGWSLRTNNVAGSFGATFSVPEPSTTGVFALGAAVAGVFGLVAWRKKRAGNA